MPRLAAVLLTLAFALITALPLSALAQGPVLHLPFDGDVADKAGGANIRTRGNTIFVPGVQGQALHLDGNRDYLSLGKGFHLPGEFTVSFWVRPATIRRKYPAVFAKYGTNNTGPYTFGLSYDKSFIWFSTSKGDHTECASRQRVPRDQWTHLAYTGRNRRVTLFVNGQEDASASYNPITRNGDEVTVGRQAFLFGDNSQLKYKGDLDDLRLYHRVLDNGEIEALHARGRAAVKARRDKARQELMARQDKARAVIETLTPAQIPEMLKDYVLSRGSYSHKHGYDTMPAFKAVGSNSIMLNRKYHRASLEVVGADFTETETQIYVKFTPHWDYNGRYTKLSLDSDRCSGAHTVEADLYLKAGGQTMRHERQYPVCGPDMPMDRSSVSLVTFPYVAPEHRSGIYLESHEKYAKWSIGPFRLRETDSPSRIMLRGLVSALDGEPDPGRRLAMAEAAISYFWKFDPFMFTDMTIAEACDRALEAAIKTGKQTYMDRVLAAFDIPKAARLLDDDIRIQAKNSATKNKTRNAGIVFRHTFKRGTIGQRYVPSLEKTRRVVVDSYWVGSQKVEKYKYQKFVDSGHNQNRQGYTAIYQFINESRNHYVMNVDVEATGRFSNYNVESASWGTEQRRVLKNKRVPIRKRVTYILDPGERLKDQVKVGEDQPTDFAVHLRDIHKVNKSWIRGLDQALSGKSMSQAKAYLADKRASNWHGELRSALDKAVMGTYGSKVGTSVSLDKYFDPDFESEAVVSITNNSGTNLAVTWSSPFATETVKIRSGQNFKKTYTVSGHAKKDMKITIKKLETY